MGSLVRYRAGYRSVNLLPNLACGGSRERGTFPGGSEPGTVLGRGTLNLVPRGAVPFCHQLARRADTLPPSNPGGG